MAKRTPPSSARTAAPSTTAGRASARPAASGTRSSRKAPRRDRAGRRGRAAPARAACFALEAAGRRNRTRRRASPSGIAELDRVTGGGFVRGSVLLIGGDPGIGKSTLLIQAAAALAQRRPPRRSTSPARRRWRRCGCAPSGSASADAPVELAAETSVEDIIATLVAGQDRRASSSSTRSRPCGPTTVESAPGTVTQVRGSAQALIRFAKTLRRRRHPGRPRHQGRPDRRPARGRAHGRRGALLRGRRRAPVPHPARGEEPLRPDRRDRRVRDDRRGPARGRRTRPSCSSPSAISARPAPRCSPASRARGRCWSKSRRWSRRPRSARRAAPWSAGTRAGSSMVLAVLEAHCGVRLGGHDVYLNVAGGLRIKEPAADLAAAAALVSSLADAPLPADAVYFGEVVAVRRGPPGGAGAGAAEGGREARLRPRGRAGIGARRGRFRQRHGAQRRRLAHRSGRRHRARAAAARRPRLAEQDG